ncbi:MAG: glycosyltransferase family 4 protein [Chloroflexi bacterium]|nr:glycosyltransferase family 4 protein [Chloroflexota bacterium]
MRVLLLTHVFPRAAEDPLGAFLLHLTQCFGERANVLVVAPHAAGLADRENFGAVQVTRFHYAPDAQETLAYTGVMHEQVARGIGGQVAFLRFTFHYLRSAWAATRAYRPDVIHAHWWLPGGLVGALASKLSGTPLVLTTHGTDVEQLRKARWAQPLARFAFGQARVITCGSNYLRERLSELAVANAAHVRVIPMPVNPVFVARDRRPETGDWGLEIGNWKLEDLSRTTAASGSVAGSARDRNSKLKILTVARLTKQKSIDTLIDALQILRGRGVDARLQIVGDGDQRAALEKKTRELKLDGFVEFLGMRSQNDLPAMYAQCDVFVLPSLREGMGLVLAEALLCGAPVIATNSGGVTDIVRDGETGLLFPERDANALADALEKFAREPEYAAQLAQKGRAWVMERFTPERVAAQFLQMYEG